MHIDVIVTTPEHVYLIREFPDLFCVWVGDVLSADHSHVLSNGKEVKSPVKMVIEPDQRDHFLNDPLPYLMLARV